MLGVGEYGPLGREHRPTATRVADLATARAGSAADRCQDGSSAAGGNPELAAEREALAVLVTVDGLGPATLGRLLAAAGGAAALLRLAAEPGGAARVASCARDGDGGRPLPLDLAGRVVAATSDAARILDRIRAVGLTPISLVDASYPARLRAIALPPHVLFVRGDPSVLGAARSVAVVGTRRPTENGRRLAARIGSTLARSGATVVSGLAVGIDGAAHAAAVAEGGPTVAVLGGGHEHLHPRAHLRLAEVIAARGGAVISELGPDVVPSRGTFPRRNRLISGLAESTIVVEAGARSGALTTAAWALEQGRGCFLVPGAIDAPMSAGCLALLRECPGEARIVTGIPQLLEDLGLTPSAALVRRPPGETRVRARAHPPAPAAAAVLATIGDVERRVAAALVAGLATVDELVAAVDLPVGAVLGALTLLEHRGLVTSAYGRYQPAGVLAGASAAGP